MRSEQACAIAADDLPIPVKGVLGRALLRLEIHVNQAEALTIAFRPLEIVHQAPGKIAAHISAAAARAGELAQIALHEIDSLRIVYLAIERDPIGNRGAVLSDHDWELVTLIVKARAPVQTAGHHIEHVHQSPWMSWRPRHLLDIAACGGAHR